MSYAGYSSYVAPMGEIEAARRPRGYAREVALATIGARAGRSRSARDGDQRSLF